MPRTPLQFFVKGTLGHHHHTQLCVTQFPRDVFTVAVPPHPLGTSVKALFTKLRSKGLPIPHNLSTQFPDTQRDYVRIHFYARRQGRLDIYSSGCFHIISQNHSFDKCQACQDCSLCNTLECKQRIWLVLTDSLSKPTLEELLFEPYETEFEPTPLLLYGEVERQ